MIRLKDVAARCGVSIATVSKALNGMPGVSEATIKRVRQMAQEMRYLPNAAARALKTNRSLNIGVLMFTRDVSPTSHEFFSIILGAIQQEAERHRYDVTLISRSVISAAGSSADYCRSRNYDGVIVMAGGFDEPELNDLLACEIPVVTVEGYVDGRSGVLSNNWQGMETLTQHVLRQGHRRVAFIHGELTAITRERIEGYRAALREAGVTPEPDYLRQAAFHDPQASARETRRLMELPEPPTCILYPDDFSLLGGKGLLEQMGRRIPEDISIAGYDGILLSQVMRPRVCTLEQDGRGMGESAMRLLLRAIEEPSAFQPQCVVLPGRLLAGESVARIA